MEANRGIGHRQSRPAAGRRRRRGEAALTAEHDAASLQPIDPLDSQHGKSALAMLACPGRRAEVDAAALPQTPLSNNHTTTLSLFAARVIPV